MKKLFLSLSLISSLVFAGPATDQLGNIFETFSSNLVTIGKNSHNKNQNKVIQAMILNTNQLLQEVTQLAQQYNKIDAVKDVVDHLLANVQNLDKDHIVHEIKKRIPQISGAEPKDLCIILFFVELEEIFQDC